jgi:hypothetical protein
MVLRYGFCERHSMTAIETRPELDVLSGFEAKLVVQPTDISFHDLPGDLVQVQVKIHNEGWQPSRPTFVRLESAPLGVFVPWRPLAVLPVPAIEPGETFEVKTQAKRPRPTPLGNFDRVPPSRVLTALEMPDEPAPQPKVTVGLGNMFNLLRKAQTGQIRKETSLSPDLMDLLGNGQPHWAGNINVFVGHRAVERHRATALRVYPGRTNLAMFVVGSAGKPDAYTFDLVGLRSDWKAALHNVSDSRSLVVDPSNAPIRATRWVEAANGGLVIMLATRPPVHCEEGNVEIHVTRQSTMETAFVEFNLSPSAQGTGCYYASV